MGKPLIPGGYILLSKKIIDSEIFKKPPLYIKVWVYLLSIAQYKDFKQLKRGQCRTSIPEIQEACSWFVGYRKEVPTKDQIFQIIEWLRKPHESNAESNGSPIMITTTKATQGILVNIENYSLYQDSKNYESNEESNDDIDTKAMREQRTPDNINKEDKEEKKNKKENKDIIGTYTNNSELKEAIKDFVLMRTKIKKVISDKGISLILKKLDGLTNNDDEKIAILNQSIEHSWQSVFPLKEDYKGGSKSNGQHKDNTESGIDDDFIARLSGV